MNAVTENIIQTGEPSRSALRVAIFRAVHQLLDEPIVFDDPIALPILGSKTEAEVRHDPFQFNDPLSRAMRASMILRSMLAEEELSRSVAQGVKQYVVLGAGLDTFAFRNTHAEQGLKVYEVDHPATQAWKSDIVRNALIDTPESLTYVPVNFEKDSLAEKLKEAGFQADKPAYFSWLGVAIYLTREAVFETLKFVSSLPKGSGITFDYAVTLSLLDPISAMMMESVGKMFAQQGEPWKTFFDPSCLAEDLRNIGFESISDFSTDDLNMKYLSRRKDGLWADGAFRLMCARN